MNLLLRHTVHLAAIGLLAVLPACQTASQSQNDRRFPTPGADWKTSVGQLRYVTPQRSVIGETVVSRHGSDDFQLDFLTGPGVPLMRLRETGGIARAEGLFARGSWQGNPARAGRLSGWMALREVFAALDQRKGSAGSSIASPAGSPVAWSASEEAAGKGSRRISVEFPRTKERFIFVLAR